MGLIYPFKVDKATDEQHLKYEKNFDFETKRRTTIQALSHARETVYAVTKN